MPKTTLHVRIGDSVLDKVGLAGKSNKHEQTHSLSLSLFLSLHRHLEQTPLIVDINMLFATARPWVLWELIVAQLSGVTNYAPSFQNFSSQPSTT